MNDTIVTVRFTDLGAARRALRILKLLDSEGQLRVRAAALVERSAQGRICCPSGAEGDEEGHDAGEDARRGGEQLQGPRHAADRRHRQQPDQERPRSRELAA